MSLPRAEAQGKRADDLLKAASAARQGNTEQPAPQPAAPAAPQEAPKEPATPAAAPAAPVAPAPQADPGLAQRHRVLEGKYNAEVPRLAALAKAEKERAEKAERELEELRKKQNSQPLVSPEEVKEFGEPLVDMARRIAREENRVVVEENEKLKAKVDELGAQVGSTAQVGQRLNTQSFYAALDAKNADWRVINDTPEFLTWLDGVDPLYGRSRQEILDEAQNALDANRVAAFFTAFKADVQSRAAPRTEALESQITPSTIPGQPVTPDAGKKIWTPALITKFYDDVRRGKYTTEEAGRIELDIQAAPREGRYRQK